MVMNLVDSERTVAGGRRRRRRRRQRRRRSLGGLGRRPASSELEFYQEGKIITVHIAEYYSCRDQD